MDREFLITDEGPAEIDTESPAVSTLRSALIVGAITFLAVVLCAGLGLYLACRSSGLFF